MHSQALDDTAAQAPRTRPRSASHDVGAHVGAAAASGNLSAIGAQGMLTLQRSIGNSAVAALAEPEREHDPLEALAQGGRALPTALRTEMETRLGEDFGDVRIHTDDAAHESARDLGAKAYTTGSDVAFQHGHFDPSSRQGKETIAHELTHVVQQRSGPVSGSANGHGQRVSDPGDHHEQQAVKTAQRAMEDGPHLTLGTTAAGHSDHAAVQRDEDPDADDSFADRLTQLGAVNAGGMAAQSGSLGSLADLGGGAAGAISGGEVGVGIPQLPDVASAVGNAAGGAAGGLASQVSETVRDVANTAGELVGPAGPAGLLLSRGASALGGVLGGASGAAGGVLSGGESALEGALGGAVGAAGGALDAASGDLAGLLGGAGSLF